jgi:hypothetical protein
MGDIDHLSTLETATMHAGATDASFVKGCGHVPCGLRSSAGVTLGVQARYLSLPQPRVWYFLKS